MSPDAGVPTPFVNTEAERLSGEKVGFSFGQNWQKYVKGATEERVAIACQTICAFTGLDSLRNETFLDAGCGSGVFSLAAYRLGAARVISLDIDPYSIASTRSLHARAGRPANWVIVRGSVLAPPFRPRSFSFVYSWGVLHHTGAMWDAMSRVGDLVDAEGRYYIAIYRQRRSSPAWLRLKRVYNRLPQLGKRAMVAAFAVYYVARAALRGKNPIRVIRDYDRSSRGMSWIRDIEDWLGGLPYEYATPEAVKRFLAGRGYDCLREPDEFGMEYLFRRRAVADQLPAASRRTTHLDTTSA